MTLELRNKNEGRRRFFLVIETLEKTFQAAGNAKKCSTRMGTCPLELYKVNRNEKRHEKSQELDSHH
jgi:hypothetical protein